MPGEVSATELQAEAAAFRDRFQTLLLATTSPDGTPDASYAPYVRNDTGATYVFISELARHTKNIFSNPVVSLMWIENEEETRNPFARKRLILDAIPTSVPKGSEEWTTSMNGLGERFGNTIGLLASLPDFHLVRLDIQSGNYVRGFGQAFEVTGNSLEICPIRRGS